MQSSCKKCHIIACRLSRHKNPDSINAYARKYRKANIEKILTYRREWYKANREKINLQKRINYRKNKGAEKARLKRHRNPKKYRAIGREEARKRRQVISNRLSQNMATAIWASLKGKKNNKKWELLVGYTLRQLKNHLEKQFKKGMSWANYSRYGWHIDHIRPISSFRFTSYDDQQFKECWRLENLQPLWAKENLSKGSRIIDASVIFTQLGM